MKNEFLTVKEEFKVWNGTIAPCTIIFYASPYGYAAHATPLSKQLDAISGSLPTKLVADPSTDYELIRAWNHATIAKKHGVYASKDILKAEIENRGYTLSENGHRWKKPEVAI